ncbi:glycosyltransferase, group 1 family protein [Leptospira yanagawae serovar Saopaulo str. Sao Paulo = ATCC 700523]|uniref:Glycosyltransferase, group 1 family protein n=1 Tax=Leptospira yanagawae serovar Saopaulo str. Sao Paulo = ATCC 700523 TaxID=1249483 RepID=A0A5E8HD78_9LEPT|nr:glycosyltransferase family 4 protein [Leptospira yanagawae]EOQ89199.1 glycosyltransferase, group 1 family protein [Leptospira yanagawae serovar Saopaulo str. Sao Paulo = ATCC 700523]
MNIHQFSAGFQLGDAISQEMLEIKRLLAKENYEGNIFAENVLSSDRKFAEKLTKANIKPKDVIVYHHSIHSKVLDFLLQFPNKKILIYHNVTPESFFEAYDLRFSYLLRKGREDLSVIKNNFQHSFAVSQFNLNELIHLGFKQSRIFPLHLNFQKWNLNSEDTKTKAYSYQTPSFLFVGRIAPNKCQDDLIRFARTWKSNYGNNFSLRMLGFCNPDQQSYLDELNFMITQLDLQEEVKIIPYVDESMLKKIYSESNLFLSMSEHEGFCVPLMEAMHFQLPVVAYAAGAVPETLGEAGYLFHSKDFDQLAKEIYKIFQNNEYRNTILFQQNQRLDSYLKSTSILPLLEVIKS